MTRTERRRLVVLVERDPDPACDACKGNGVFVEEVTEHVCFCCRSSYLFPGSEDIAAHVAALPHAEAVEVLRALLRAVPDAAVEAVDTCKVAREWRGQGGEHEGRAALGGGGRHASFVGPAFQPARDWVYVVPGAPAMLPHRVERAPTKQEARDASDRAWAADGWVFAGGAR